MDYDLTADQLEIRDAAREALTRTSSIEQARGAAERGVYDEAVLAQQIELGWPSIAIPEEHGGSGLGVVDLAVLAEEGGYALAGSPLLSSASAALVIAAAGSPEQRAEWLPRIADGSATGALAVRGHATESIVADVVDADVVAVVQADGTATLLTAADAEVTPVDAIDPTRRYGTVRGEGVAMPGDPTPGLDGARVAVAAETIGVCRRALDITVPYVSQREQFGRPIGSFQAVQHMLVEMLLLTEGARSGTYWAAWALDAGADEAHEAALIAKAAAADAGRTVTSNAIQAHGGIGFTWEADLHWLFKRAQLNARALGGAPEHRALLSTMLAGRVPVAAA
jgi:alkylation response protein AidB-like acyl-CoA dehydrogenase